MKFLLYGANGYTAQLMLPLCAQYGLEPILAGRSEDKIKPLATQYGFDYRIIDLNSPAALDEGLQGVGAVLHCAGPFAYTARQMMDACLRNRVHYLDITGEISVFELAHQLDAQAKAQGITLLPGSGFDVVPTDCLALDIQQALPDATELRLAFVPVKGGLSHGTANTMIDTMGSGGKVRRNGQIVAVPFGYEGRMIDFGVAQQFCTSIPWGDVSTAFYTTGIPNITVFTGSSPKAHASLKWKNAFRFFYKIPFVKAYLKKKIQQRPAGPSAERREKAYTMLWGEAKNAKGETVVRTQVVKEGYTLTAHTALWLTKQLLDSKGKPGFWTPAGLFGSGIVRNLKLEQSA